MSTDNNFSKAKDVVSHYFEPCILITFHQEDSNSIPLSSNGWLQDFVKCSNLCAFNFPCCLKCLDNMMDIRLDILQHDQVLSIAVDISIHCCWRHGIHWRCLCRRMKLYQTHTVTITIDLVKAAFLVGTIDSTANVVPMRYGLDSLILYCPDLIVLPDNARPLGFLAPLMDIQATKYPSSGDLPQNPCHLSPGFWGCKYITFLMNFHIREGKSSTFPMEDFIALLGYDRL